MVNSARPAITWSGGLKDPALRRSVLAAVRTCRDHLPPWCRTVRVEFATEREERVGAGEPMPAVMLPAENEPAVLVLYIRHDWMEAPEEERVACLLFWAFVDVLCSASDPLTEALARILMAAGAGTGGEAALVGVLNQQVNDTVGTQANWLARYVSMRLVRPDAPRTPGECDLT